MTTFFIAKFGKVGKNGNLALNAKKVRFGVKSLCDYPKFPDGKLITPQSYQHTIVATSKKLFKVNGKKSKTKKVKFGDIEIYHVIIYNEEKVIYIVQELEQNHGD